RHGVCPLPGAGGMMAFLEMAMARARGGISDTTENYLKTLYALQQQVGPGPVPLGRIATALGLTPGTVTTMVKALAARGYVDYRSRHGAALSKAGQAAALRVLRRHRLIEQFLVQVVGVDWSQVHEDAEVLEHAISD